ncbi:FtsX-like permease family protein [Pedobacter petrophilus]|uniref:FtsX-like permease family protein n=1 Tax=Pedobacter petrophilus TaxID=1908241 RepID=A0A7K0G3P6_9SPHI|nr:ABC transporter permease [Pedobacter petrophilus]MRX78428.1 FtsX-like permease family protein [Pedobacter petrophilus]
MFKLNLKIALRNLWKNKGYTFINVIGLSIGMASCILIFLFIRYQLSFDEGFKNENRIYRMVTDWKYDAFDDYSNGVSIPAVNVVKNEIVGLEKTAAIFRRWSIIRVRDEAGKDLIKNDETIYYSEPDFFEIFGAKWLFGNSYEALSQPNTAALSETSAKKYFGNVRNAMGKSITMGNKTLLKVTGVFKDMPKNSSFPLNVVVSYQTFPDKADDCWDCVSSGNELYVLLKDGLKAEDITASLAQFNKNNYADRKVAGNQRIEIEALRAIHFSEHYDNFSYQNIGKTQLYGLAIIALFLIVTACINFINLSTAQAINRAKEVGVRKVMGGMRKQLVMQFLSETFIVTLVAMLIACVLAELCIPQFQNLFKGQLELGLFQHPVIFIFMILLVLFVGFLAGFYPSMIMSGFNPALAIKNKVALNNGGLSLRKILVVVQFAISIILIISTIVVMRQMEFVQQKPLGFNSSEVMMVALPNDSLNRLKHENFKQRLLSIPGVKMVSFCQNPPLSPNINSSDFTFNGIKNKDFEVRRMQADEDYYALFDLKLIAGKLFAKGDKGKGYVVNETFIKKVHINNPQDAIGKVINSNGENIPIIGVIKDFNDLSLKEKISGLTITTGKNNYWRAAIKLDAKQVFVADKKVEELWNRMFPSHIYSSTFVNEDINGQYETEKIMGVLFKVFAGVIIFISFIGLFGLISFVATQRTKEMAIRKVLGASTFELVKMLNGSFLMMVFIANIIAWPIAYLFVNGWLNGFAYRMELSVWPFILAMCITMIITMLTVSIRSYKAAVTNAVDALKYE